MEKETTQIYGIRSVIEAIESEKSLNRVFIQRGLTGASAFELIKTLNKKSVEKIRKWDIFNLEKNMPRWFMQIPYDILNRFNRNKLQDKNKSLVDDIKYTDYSISEMTDQCLDYFCIVTK